VIVSVYHRFLTRDKKKGERIVGGAGLSKSSARVNMTNQEEICNQASSLFDQVIDCKYL
jgi:hypothetical protein